MIKYQDDKYQRIVGDILENEEFNKIRYIEHHGTTRFEHSVRVSYFSYRFARLFHLDYEEVARAGLLHDFFLSDQDRNQKDRILSTFNHPKKACMNSCRIFGLNEKEEDIIESHMFPLNIRVPKYAESWVVSCVDKVVGAIEFVEKARYKAIYLGNVYILCLINIVK